MKLKNAAANEDGFWSIITIIILVTLGLMTMGSYVIIRSEGTIAADRAQGVQAEFAATSGIYYALKRSVATGDSSYSVTLDGTASSVSLTPIVSTDFNRDVTVSNTVAFGSVSHSISVVLDVFDRDVTIWCNGLVNDINPQNSSGWYDDDRMVELANSMLNLDVTALLALPNAQDLSGGTYGGTQPSGAGSFFQPSSTTPWVTRYTGNLTLNANSQHYGIVIVTGDLDIGSNARIDGIIYMPDPNSDINMQANSFVDGCVVCGGESTGNRWVFWIFSGVNTDVRNNPTYIDAILPYVTNPSAFISTAYNIHTWNE